jgi:hypothetical protein
MAELADHKPEGWAGRPDGGDARLAPGTNGAPSGTNGVWVGARAILISVALVSTVAGVNVLTELDDAHRRGEALPALIPIVLEVTSALGSLLSMPIVYLAVRWQSLARRPWPAALGAHFVGSLAFSALHVALMELFRWAAFGALRISHHWSPAEWPYEYRKDLISYIVMAGALWLLGAPGLRRAPPAPSQIEARPEPDAPLTFDIREGAALLRTPMAEILAARAAGNYVEFLLRGGRRPLIRASLRNIEAELARGGFLRTHRSWLVNARHVRALVPIGSGDFRIDLDAGESAPLSRRFPATLARLRGDGG